MSLINDIINRHVDDRKGQHVFISRQQIAAICRDYADNVKPKPEKKKRSITHRVKIAYSKGVKHGYMLHADEQYEKAMFEMWKKHIAGPTEANACFNEHARFADVENLEIVEPEVIVK